MDHVLTYQGCGPRFPPGCGGGDRGTRLPCGPFAQGIGGLLLCFIMTALDNFSSSLA